MHIVRRKLHTFNLNMFNSVLCKYIVYNAIACDVLLFGTLEAVAHCVLPMHFIQSRTTDTKVYFYGRNTMFVMLRSREILYETF